MSSAWPISRVPVPHNADRAADAAKLVDGAAPEFRDLVLGVAGCSPYLAGLILRDADFVGELAERSPDAAMADLMAETRTLAAEALASGLRRIKGKVALLAALADLGGVWPLEAVTGALSDFADLAVDRSIKALVAKEARRGKLPGVAEDAALEDAGGMTVLAMGKMGAGELNYSSDIDLICLFDETRYEPAVFHDARAALIRATRNMAQMLSEMTGEGYVFRTDLRLRPDPSVTPVCLGMEAAERYYESVGRTWERAAYVKARAAAGDIGAGEDFLHRLRPFVWRRHLDFAAIEDAHDMRLRIRAHKGTGGPLELEGHDVKLGLGGIREIEFFTQTRQIIAGGRDESLRLRATVPSLAALAARKWVSQDVAETLTRDYRALREIEHRLQMVADAQTHALPTNDDGFLRLARMMGHDDAGVLRSVMIERFARVHELTEEFFAGGPPARARSSEDHAETIARWMRLPAMRSERARERFKRLSPMIFERLGASTNAREAVLAFESFLSGLPAGVQLFALFEANPQLVDLIIDIVGTAPALADYLGKNAGVLDAVIGGEFFSPWPGIEALTELLSVQVGQAQDYEAQLDALRRSMKEWHFRIGVHHLRGHIDAVEAGQQYADLAEAVLRAIWPAVVAEFAAKHGDPPGRGAAILGMGSLGARQLNAASDLDLIVIYDARGADASDGRRPLASRTYYARLTQALVTALSAPMAEGKLYEVDMRLRPSGRQGPVATSLGGFVDYQRNEAWGWEHLALTRARPVAGDRGVAAELEAFRVGLLAQLGKPGKVLRDVAEMRARLNEAQPRRSVWDVKAGPGGMRELELVGQAAALAAGSPDRDFAAQIERSVALGWISGEEAEALEHAYDLYWRVVAAERALIAGTFDPEAAGPGGRAFLVSVTSQSGMDSLAEALENAFAEVDAIIGRVIAERADRTG